MPIIWPYPTAKSRWFDMGIRKSDPPKQIPPPTVSPKDFSVRSVKDGYGVFFGRGKRGREVMTTGTRSIADEFMARIIRSMCPSPSREEDA